MTDAATKCELLAGQPCDVYELDLPSVHLDELDLVDIGRAALVAYVDDFEGQVGAVYQHVLESDERVPMLVADMKPHGMPGGLVILYDPTLTLTDLGLEHGD